MSPGPTFDRVYRALKDSLMAAAFAPGEHLEPVALGERFHASATPVRDALHRLAGEGLVEAPLHEGFRAPTLTEPELRDLFGWRLRLAELALRKAAPARPFGVTATSPFAPAPESAAELFLAIVRSTASEAHAAAMARLCERLAAVATVEPLLFDDVAEELAELLLLLASGDRAALLRGVAAYHRRRQRAAPDLLATLRRETGRRRRPEFPATP